MWGGFRIYTREKLRHWFFFQLVQIIKQTSISDGALKKAVELLLYCAVLEYASIFAACFFVRAVFDRAVFDRRRRRWFYFCTVCNMSSFEPNMHEPSPLYTRFLFYRSASRSRVVGKGTHPPTRPHPTPPAPLHPPTLPAMSFPIHKY